MLRIRDIMTRDVVTVSPDLSLRDTMDLLTRHHISGAPVVSGTEVMGVVTTTDLLAFAASDAGRGEDRERETTWREWDGGVADEDEEPEVPAPDAFFAEVWDAEAPADAAPAGTIDRQGWDALEAHDVSEVMTRELWALPSSSDAREAAALMREHGVHRVLVVDDGKLVGIVSALDIARAAADKRFTTREFVFNRDSDFRSEY